MKSIDWSQYLIGKNEVVCDKQSLDAQARDATRSLFREVGARMIFLPAVDTSGHPNLIWISPGLPVGDLRSKPKKIGVLLAAKKRDISSGQRGARNCASQISGRGNISVCQRRAFLNPTYLESRADAIHFSTQMAWKTTMNDRPALQRALLRRVLRKQIHQDQTTKKQIELVLDDGPLFETTYETVMELATEFGRATGIFSVSINSTGQPVASNLFKLLQWFLANGPELVKIIEQVMDLFGSVSVTAHLVAQECQHGV